MPKARKTQVALEATPYYHCISRCVRRAFLCGKDHLSGQDYSHRRGWIEQRLFELNDIFALDLCAYAVMSNHLHVVLHINRQQADNWSMREVVERWHRLFSGTIISQRFLRGEKLLEVELNALAQLAERWRQRLCDISWFMRCVNEPIARRANQEDQCTGRFWEGRFKCQALLDEKALAACLAYVDLNPVRAGMARTPEQSNFTSIQKRMNAVKEKNAQPQSLHPFVGNSREPMPQGLPFQLNDYLELVEWTARIQRDDKRGSVGEEIPPLLEHLQIDPDEWRHITGKFESRFRHLVGTAYRLKAACQSLGYRRTPGLGACQQVFG